MTGRISENGRHSVKWALRLNTFRKKTKTLVNLVPCRISGLSLKVNGSFLFTESPAQTKDGTLVDPFPDEFGYCLGNVTLFRQNIIDIVKEDWMEPTWTEKETDLMFQEWMSHILFNE